MTDIRRPWSLDPGRTPVERILGREFADRGPLGLLGLDPGDCTPETIAAALARQLERIAEHPHATSHEADEVRLALHAAAAQLMDPRTRDVIVAGALAGRAAQRPRRPLNPVIIARARGEIRRTLGRYGGLNEKSIRFLTLIVEKHGISRDQLAEAVRAAVRDPSRPARRPAVTATGESPAVPRPPRPAAPGREARAGAPSASTPSALPSGQPQPLEIDPAVRALRTVVILICVGIITLAAAVGVVWAILRTTSGPARDPASPTSQPSAPAIKAPSTPTERRADAPAQPPQSVPKQDAIDPVAVSRSLADAVEKLGANAESSLDQFASAYAALGSSWVELEPDRAASVQDSIVEFLYRAASHPAVVEQATRVILSDASALRGPPLPIVADRVLPGVWSVGVLARLARERDLPAHVRAMIDSELAASLPGAVPSGPGTFAGSASGALLSLSRSLVRPREGETPPDVATPEAFDRWLQASRYVTGSDTRALDRLTLGALETVLLDGPEPEPLSPAAAVVARLVGAISWQGDGDARPRLLRWFDSSQISSVDLNAVTAALVARSAAEGVDASMVLPVRAELPARQELRDRYLGVWALKDQVAVDALVAEWARVARQHSAPESDPPEPVAQLARATILARVNLAASQLQAGLSAEPGEILRAVDAPVLAVLNTPGPGAAFNSLDDGASDGAWAVRYLAAEKNIPQRAALLAELGQFTGVLGQVDAEAIAAEAFRGAPAQVRRAAADLMVKFASSPAVINAAIEQAPFIPRTLETTELVRKLSLGRVPGVREPDWRIGIRRALVERLLQMLAAKGGDRSVDALAGVLAEAYSGRASVGAVDHSAKSAAERASPDTAARTVRLAWQRWAEATTPSGREPFTVEQIQRRHDGRTGLSEGLVQGFAAEQVTTAELMAFVIAGERPDAASDVRGVLDRLGTARRKAEHIFGQILATERAMTELWMIRMRVESPS